MNFKIYTELYSKLSYTPCYALVPTYLVQNLIWNTKEKQKEFWGGFFKFEYLYIKENDERFEKVYSNHNKRIS